MKNQRKLIYAAAIGVAGIALFLFFKPGEQQAEIAMASAEVARLPVTVVPVEARMVDRTVTLPGELMPFEGTDIYAKVSGYVEEIPVDRGSAVKQNELLAKLIAPEMKAQVAESNSKLQVVKARLAESEARLIREKTTYQFLQAASKTPGAIAGLEVVKARDTAGAAAAEVEAGKRAVDAAQSSLDAVAVLEQYLSITAPFDGQIVKRMVHPGALAGPMTGPLLRIEQLNRLRLVIAVPEQEVGKIEHGRELEFHVSAYPGKLFSGKVSRLAGSNDVKTRSMAIELDVDNADGGLAPGMYPEVLWPVVRAAQTMLVPELAIVTTTERQFVIRVSASGAAEWVDVRQGPTYGNRVEVQSPALMAGDLIVERGTDEIRVGTALEPTQAKATPLSTVSTTPSTQHH